MPRTLAQRLSSRTSGVGNWTWAGVPEFKAEVVGTKANGSGVIYHFSDGSRGIVRKGSVRFTALSKPL